MKGTNSCKMGRLEWHGGRNYIVFYEKNIEHVQGSGRRRSSRILQANSQLGRIRDWQIDTRFDCFVTVSLGSQKKASDQKRMRMESGVR